LARHNLGLFAAATHNGLGTTGNIRDGRRDAISHQRLDLFTKLIDLPLCVSHRLMLRSDSVLDPKLKGGILSPPPSPANKRSAVVAPLPEKGIPDRRESSKRKHPARSVERLLPDLQGFPLGKTWR
jgi:hypothetical protein